MKLTKQRKLILETLRGLDTHPTADTVYVTVREHIPNISLGTVYRNLEFLTSAGVIRKIDTGRGCRNYDGNPEGHHHLVCEKCGAVSDAPGENRIIISYNKNAFPGFDVKGHSFILRGICGKCSRKRKEN